jgi:hypothetical protein
MVLYIATYMIYKKGFHILYKIKPINFFIIYFFIKIFIVILRYIKTTWEQQKQTTSQMSKIK